jgi:multidrug efflux pump subunit AcrB
MVSFASERLQHHGDAMQAAIEAGFTRFRPVLMTALAMRAVIGGLLFATVATLIFVPTVFSLLHGRRDSSAGPAPSKERA